MKIVVLIKENLDLNSVDLEDDAYLSKDMDLDDIIMNPNDKHAIEAALEIKESKEDTIVHVMCLGSENALKVLREAIGMGCDEASRINVDGIDFLLSTYSKSIILGKALESHNPDIIITGMYSNDFGQAQLPVLLACSLKYSQITYANSLEIDGTNIIAERYVEGGSIKISVGLPSVISIASTANEPRYTSVRRIMLAKKTEIPDISLDDLELSEDKLQNAGNLEIVEITKPELSKIDCFKVEDEDISAGVDKLIDKLKEDGIDLTVFKN